MLSLLMTSSSSSDAHYPSQSQAHAHAHSRKKSQHAHPDYSYNPPPPYPHHHHGYHASAAAVANREEGEEEAHASAPSSYYPVPPPFDPTGDSGNELEDGGMSAHAAEGRFNSVVPDLMRVYESLTQSSTPQAPTSTTNSVMNPADYAYDKDIKGVSYETALVNPYNAPSQQRRYNQYHPQNPVWNGNEYEDGSNDANANPASSETARTLRSAKSGSKSDRESGRQSSVNSEDQQSSMDVVGSADNASTEEANNKKSSSSTTSTRKTRSLRKRPSNSLSDSNNNNNDGGSITSGESDGGGGGRGNSSSGKMARRKSEKDSDGRWSKRFTWPEELHRDFVSAVFDVGLKHSSPSSILEHMAPHAQLNTERIKSHLQKYRLYRAKSKKEFMASYDASLTQMQKKGLDGFQSLAAGEVASYATFSVMKDDEMKEVPSSSAAISRAPSSHRPPPLPKQEPDDGVDTASAMNLKRPPASASGGISQDTIVLPRLTEAEKQSPMGASMGYLMGLFFSLRQQLMAQRAAAHEAALAAASSTNASGVPMTRHQWEQSSKMKREMEGQMAFQNKMRALKQQELNKYRQGSGGEMVEGMGHPSNGDTDHESHMVWHSFAYESSQPMATEAAGVASADVEDDVDGTANEGVDDVDASSPPLHMQHAQAQSHGEGALPNQRSGSAPVNEDEVRKHKISIGGSEEFWQTDVMDDHLFEFLMSE
jgi:SHAQKYF class myb-like DNA-binding protein